MKAVFSRPNLPYELHIFLGNEKEIMSSRALAMSYDLELYYDLWSLMDAKAREEAHRLVEDGASSEEVERLFEPYLKQLQEQEVNP